MGRFGGALEARVIPHVPQTFVPNRGAITVTWQRIEEVQVARRTVATVRSGATPDKRGKLNEQKVHHR